MLNAEEVRLFGDNWNNKGIHEKCNHILIDPLNQDDNQGTKERVETDSEDRKSLKSDFEDRKSLASESDISSEGNQEDDFEDSWDSRWKQASALVTEEHTKMLISLRKEVDALKRKNRDLQFQLVMQSTSTKNPNEYLDVKKEQKEEEDDQLRIFRGPHHYHELTSELERKIKLLQNELHEAKSRNIYLANLVDEQKRKLMEAERTAKQSEKLNSQVLTRQIELEKDCRSLRIQLEVAESMINNLKLENANQKQQLIALDKKSALEIKQNILKFRGCNHPTRLRSWVNPKSSKMNAVVASKTSPSLTIVTSIQDGVSLRMRNEKQSLSRLRQNPSSLLRNLRSGNGNILPPVSKSTGRDAKPFKSKVPLNLVAMNSINHKKTDGDKSQFGNSNVENK